MKLRRRAAGLKRVVLIAAAVFAAWYLVRNGHYHGSHYYSPHMIRPRRIRH